MAEHGCEARVYDSMTGRRYPCPCKGKYERGGKWYCGTHDPVRVKGREAKREAAYLKQRERKDRIWKRRGLESDFCQGMTNDELKAGIAKKKGAK